MPNPSYSRFGGQITDYRTAQCKKMGALLGKSGVKLVVAVLAVLRVVHLINGWNPVNRLKEI